MIILCWFSFVIKDAVVSFHVSAPAEGIRFVMAAVRLCRPMLSRPAPKRAGIVLFLFYRANCRPRGISTVMIRLDHGYPIVVPGMLCRCPVSYKIRGVYGTYTGHLRDILTFTCFLPCRWHGPTSDWKSFCCGWGPAGSFYTVLLIFYSSKRAMKTSQLPRSFP
jgi:hypothetical protein